MAPARRAADALALADASVRLAGRYGLVADPWQHELLRDWLATDKSGKLLATRCGVSVPRQNGKGAAIEIAVLAKMLMGRRVLHTAHEVKTARKAFIRLSAFFENERQFPELAGMVSSVRKTNGQEAITLTNGGSCEFIARSKGSGRGFTVDDLFMDEAQDLDEDAYAALLPTISAAPSGDPQQAMLGTPPTGKMSGDVFGRMRADALSGKSRRLAWSEWSVEGEFDIDDATLWATVNPALLAGRLGIETIRDERAAMDDETFARERLGMWAGETGRAVIDPTSWARAADMMSEPIDRLALAIDVTPDRTSGSVAVAGQRADERWHIEMVDNRNGVGWLVERVAGIVTRQGIRAVVIDGASPAQSLVEPLEGKGVTVTTTTARQMVSACGEFYDAVMEDRLRHIDQPQLSASLGGARKRSLGDAWAWHRKNATSDITPIVAATLALWGAQSEAVAQVKKPSPVFAF